MSTKSTNLTISPKQLAILLSEAIQRRLPVLIKGKPGVGKTSIVEQAAETAGCDIMVSHPVTADPTDAKGLPWKLENANEATFLPFGDLARAINATRPLVWFLDDLGQGTPAVQAAYMQLLLARRVNGHVLPNCVTFVAATNRREDRAGVSGVLEPVKSRFVTIVELEAVVEEWVEWAYGHDIDPNLIAFLRLRGELLSGSWEAKADIVNSPTPRTWSHANEVLKMNLNPDLRMIALAGAVGEGAAAELVGFLEVAAKLPPIGEFIKNPMTSPLFDDPNLAYAVVSGLARAADASNFASIAAYANRMYAAGTAGSTNGAAEFAVLLVRDAYKRQPAITQTPAWKQDIARGQIGKAVFDALA